MRGVQLSLGRSGRRPSNIPHQRPSVGEAQQPTTGRFRQSRRRICRAEIRRTEGVEASALGREKRITQDNDYYIMHDLERATPHSAQGSSRCRRVEGPLAETFGVDKAPEFLFLGCCWPIKAQSSHQNHSGSFILVIGAFERANARRWLSRITPLRH